MYTIHEHLKTSSPEPSPAAPPRKTPHPVAQAKAVTQYWGRIRTSISDQKRKRHHLAGESALREAMEDDKVTLLFHTMY